MKGYTLTKELNGLQICQTGILKIKFFLDLEPSLTMCRKEAESQLHQLWSVFWPHLARGSGDYSWRLGDPVAFEPMSRQVDLIALRAKSILILEDSYVIQRQEAYL